MLTLPIIPPIRLTFFLPTVPEGRFLWMYGRGLQRSVRIYLRGSLSKWTPRNPWNACVFGALDQTIKVSSHSDTASIVRVTFSTIDLLSYWISVPEHASNKYVYVNVLSFAYPNLPGITSSLFKMSLATQTLLQSSCLTSTSTRLDKDSSMTTHIDMPSGKSERVQRLVAIT